MPNSLTIVNVPKAGVAAAALVCITVLGAVGAISGDATVALISTVLGYVVGNGVASATGKPVQPILGTRPTEDESTDN